MHEPWRRKRGNSRAPYQYEICLLNLYKLIGTSFQKTRSIDKRFDALRDPDMFIEFKILNYLSGCDLISKKNWRTYFDDPKKLTQSDKMSNWWKITPRGFARITDQFGADILNREAQAQAAKFLLKGG